MTDINNAKLPDTTAVRQRKQTVKNVLIGYNLQFFAKDGPGGEKTEPATSKKLNDVRKEGQVAKSKEIIMAVTLMALFIIIKVYVGNMGEKFISLILFFRYFWWLLS